MTDTCHEHQTLTLAYPAQVIDRLIEWVNDQSAAYDKGKDIIIQGNTGQNQINERNKPRDSLTVC